MKELEVCAITSHRPTRFKWQYRENASGCKRLKKWIQEQIIALHEQGVCQFWVGGTVGAEMWAGEIILHLREQPEYMDIQLYITIPFKGHDRYWAEPIRSRLAYLMHHSVQTVITGNPNSWLMRNYYRMSRYMIRQADCVLAIYDQDSPERSKTREIVDYARRMERPMIFIHPDTGVVTKEGFSV